MEKLSQVELRLDSEAATYIDGTPASDTDLIVFIAPPHLFYSLAGGLGQNISLT